MIERSYHRRLEPGPSVVGSMLQASVVELGRGSPDRFPGSFNPVQPRVMGRTRAPNLWRLGAGSGGIARAQ